MSVAATARAVCAGLATLLTVACAPLPPAPGEPAAAGASPPAAAAMPSAPAAAPAAPGRPPARSLLPLQRQAPLPADAPTSRVVQIFPEPGDAPDATELPGEEFERGGGSWYGIQFHRRRTASGEMFDMTSLTAAHKTLPFGTKVCVRSLVNGREVLVHINDRGPFTPGRIIDLSQAAAERIQLTSLGFKQVSLTVIGDEGGLCDGQRVEGGLVPINVAPVVRQPMRRAPARGKAPVRRR